MKAQLRNQIAAMFILLPAATTFVAMPASAQRAVSSPELFGLEVNADSGLRPGSVLEFELEGTPRGQARVRIPGPNANVVLKETSRGIYTGSYTVRRADRINPSSTLRATLSSGKRIATENYTFPASFATYGTTPPPVAVVPPAPPPPQAQALRIERFGVRPIEKLEPGAELLFIMNGVPGGTASFDIPGVVTGAPMRETRPGHYEGTYTIRRQDNMNPPGPIVGTLRLGTQVVTANLNRRLVADGTAPVIGNISPQQGDRVTGAVTQVSATFDDAGGRGVDPRTVRITVSGRDVTGESQITAQQVTFRGNLPPGRHTVEVTARDAAGNAAQKSWSFDVGGAVAAAPTTLPLQIFSHSNNSTVDSGQVLVQGRTAPNATVQIKVDAVSPIGGNRFSVAQPMAAQTVQADANGNFSFTLAPQRSLPIPGTRYEVSVTANQGGLSAESKLVLFQRQG